MQLGSVPVFMGQSRQRETSASHRGEGSRAAQEPTQSDPPLKYFPLCRLHLAVWTAADMAGVPGTVKVVHSHSILFPQSGPTTRQNFMADLIYRLGGKCVIS